MSNEIWILALTAASIGFFHTLTGPDHYLPFIVMGKARNWSLRKTISLTFVCGLGHVLSSVALGLLGVATGVMLYKLEFIEGYRAGIAAWAFILFGLGYMLGGTWKVYKNKPHSHIHMHHDGSVHLHKHTHEEIHAHKHKANITPWILFTLFVLGPCEPLIPILMYPAAQHSVSGMILVTSIFSLFTIGTMLGIVYLTSLGMQLIPLKRIEKYMHVIAGAIIMISGLAIEFLGL